MTFMNDFPQAVNYIASAIDLTTKNSSTLARQISKLNHSGYQNKSHGRGRGRNSDRNTGGGEDEAGVMDVIKTPVGVEIETTMKTIH